ncbi:unnamed protein product, partial [marine sediment metagenome]
MGIEIDNMGKRYRRSDGEVVALEATSLSVGPGEFVSVQGPSGSGKTTLLLAAGALLRPDTGRVAIDGRNPYELPANARATFRAEKLGFVFQQFHLVPYLNVLDNILCASLPRPAKGRIQA